MKQLIQQRLQELEHTRHIKIWYACESGSRAWGFASPNSDWDVRFIYSHPLEWYLNLEEHKSMIDLGVDEQDLDFTGWDLRKLLRLMAGSNASPFEWLQSPIVYHDSTDFRAQLWPLAQAYFKPKTTAFHYYGLARNSLKKGMSNGQMDIKKYFYVLRPLLAMRWIVYRQTPPPMEFAPLLEEIKSDAAVYQAIQHLTQAKIAANEGDTIKPVPLIQRYINDTLEVCADLAQALPAPAASYDVLNQFFIQHIHPS